jgi:hypothetical protein
MDMLKKLKFHHRLHWLLITTLFLIFTSGLRVEFQEETAVSEATDSSTLALSPSSGSINQGDQLNVSVLLKADSVVVNAITVVLTYSPDLLEVVSLNTDNSSFNLGVEELLSEGKVEVTRGNYEGLSGELKVFEIVFKGKSVGSAGVSFASGSAAPRASDSKDTLDLAASLGGSYEVVSPPPPPPPPPPASPKDSENPSNPSSDEENPVNEEEEDSETPSTPASPEPSSEPAPEEEEEPGLVILPQISLPLIELPKISLPKIDLPFVKPKKGDLDRNGKVNIFDLSELLRRWGWVKNMGEADLNQDSRINIFDLTVLLGNWDK